MPKKGEVLIINGTGEKRIVPQTMLRQTNLLNEHGWREYRQPLTAPSAKEQPLPDEVLSTAPVDEDNFQTVTEPVKRGPGRRKKN